MRVHIKKPWLIIFLGFPILFIIFIVIFLYIFVDIPERNDDKMIVTVAQMGNKLSEYRKLHNQLPNTLTEAGIQEKICFTLKCIDFQYKLSQDKQNFTLAAANGGWIAYYDSTREKGFGTPYGMAVSENLGKIRTDFPIYKTDKKIFATPSVWPDIDVE